MRSASLLRVPKALRALLPTAGRQGRRMAPAYDPQQATSLRGSTWLASLNVLALC